MRHPTKYLKQKMARSVDKKPFLYVIIEKEEEYT